MEKKEAKLLLILGCQRSGTTLLASMLGRHPEINMLFESTTRDVHKGIGKEYNGNKLLTWRQIRYKQRATKLGHLVNRIVNLDFGMVRKPHKVRVFPISSLSIRDYLHKGAKIICIYRDSESVVKSIISRTEMTQKQAIKEYYLSLRELNRINDRCIRVNFTNLINDPVDTLKTICSEIGIEYDPVMLEGPKYNIVYPHDRILKEKA